MLYAIPGLLITLCLLVGSVFLWWRTRGLPAILQILGSAGFFLEELHGIVWQIAFHHARGAPSRMIEILTSEWDHTFLVIVVIVGFLAFPSGFLWFAITYKRI
jgi:hypothetical protein